jgi:hypothetical protein
MGARSETLAREFEAKIRDAVSTLRELSHSDWQKVTEAERWPIGVTAHHYAGALEPISHMVKAVVAGQSGSLTLDAIDQMNAQHAKDFADCSKAETIELLENGAAAAAAVVRGLSDGQLARSGTALIGIPPMTVEQLITAALLNHMDEHFGSIRKTLGS